MRHSLVVYYSHSGNTRRLAEMIAKNFSGDILAIVPEKAYPTSYREVVAQAKREIQAGYRPTLRTNLPDVSPYDTVFVGSPNWCGTVAPPIAAFLEHCDLSDKQVVPFCTHGGGGFGSIERDIKKLCPTSHVLPGLAVSGASFPEEQVRSWLFNLSL